MGANSLQSFSFISLGFSEMIFLDLSKGQHGRKTRHGRFTHFEIVSIFLGAR